MRLGVAIEETWDFFHEVYADLAEHHQTTLLRRRTIPLPFLHGRINKLAFRHDMRTFLQANDVVFFEWASELLAVASHLPKSCGIVTRLHRYELYHWADKVNWDAVDRIILVSREKQREFARRFPRQADKTVMIPEAVSLDRFQPCPKPFSGDVGTLCHLKPRKRVYELILAFYELVQHYPDFRLHIGGGSSPMFRDYAEALHGLVAKLNLQSKVAFYGHVANPQDWYRKIDIFVSNGYSEGLQVAPMEAMASGCYCLAHRWDGADELLPEQNLFYTNQELNALILRYSGMSEAERESERARMRAIVAENFNVDKTKVRIREVIEQVAASARSKVGVGA